MPLKGKKVGSFSNERDSIRVELYDNSNTFTGDATKIGSTNITYPLHLVDVKLPISDGTGKTKSIIPDRAVFVKSDSQIGFKVVMCCQIGFRVTIKRISFETNKRTEIWSEDMIVTHHDVRISKNSARPLTWQSSVYYSHNNPGGVNDQVQNFSPITVYGKENDFYNLGNHERHYVIEVCAEPIQSLTYSDHTTLDLGIDKNGRPNPPFKPEFLVISKQYITPQSRPHHDLPKESIDSEDDGSMYKSVSVDASMGQYMTFCLFPTDEDSLPEVIN